MYGVKVSCNARYRAGSLLLGHHLVTAFGTQHINSNHLSTACSDRPAGFGFKGFRTKGLGFRV